MHEASSDLPDDIAVLQAMIALQNEKLSIFETEIKERDYRIEKLEHQLAGLRRHRFGARSEALDQLELTLEEEEIARAVEAAVTEDVLDTSSDTPKGKPRRKPLPGHSAPHGMFLLRGHLSIAAAVASHREGTAGTGVARACAGQQVRGPSSALSAVANFRA